MELVCSGLLRSPQASGCWLRLPLSSVVWRRVAGLAPELAQVLDCLPFTLRLPAYGLTVVHAGLVPGRPLGQQRILDMIKVGDIGGRWWEWRRGLA